jgi:hypothetical protein
LSPNLLPTIVKINTTDSEGTSELIDALDVFVVGIAQEIFTFNVRRGLAMEKTHAREKPIIRVFCVFHHVGILQTLQSELSP